MAQVRINRWARTVADAREVQIRLGRRLRVGGGPRRVRLAAGADCAYSSDGRTVWAGVAVVALPSLDLMATATVAGTVTFPYVPGYLAFREGPVILRACLGLSLRPDLWLFDGQGIAHPRGLGLAAHLGVMMNVPSVGCAKSRLVGEHGELGVTRGSRTPLVFGGKEVGAVVRTRHGVRPLYLSVGHRVSLDAGVRWVLASSHYRVPEPIRLAEQLVNSARREHDGR